jgi:hypothetical protein
VYRLAPDRARGRRRLGRRRRARAAQLDVVVVAVARSSKSSGPAVAHAGVARPRRSRGSEGRPTRRPAPARLGEGEHGGQDEQHAEQRHGQVDHGHEAEVAQHRMSDSTSTAKPAIAVAPRRAPPQPVDRYVRCSASAGSWPASRSWR